MCRLSDLRREPCPSATQSWFPNFIREPVAAKFLFRGLTLIALFAAAPTINTAAPTRNKLDRILAEYADHQTRFSADMRALAEFCDLNGFPDDAARIRSLATPIDEQIADIDRLPEEVQPDIPKGLKPIEHEWRTRLRSLQHDYAQDLFLLSRRATAEGQPSQAFHWLREVAFQNPDHQQARFALGFVRYEDGWTTPFAADRRRQGSVWHDRFGWLPRSHVQKYEAGQRFYNGKWISAEREAANRSDFRHCWHVVTEHFEIHTNYSLERGVDLGRALEDFHSFFVREFAAFFNTKQQMQTLFKDGGGDRRAESPRHTIYYYRTRKEYLAALKSKQPDIQITNGLYMPGDRIAYFYDDPDNPAGVLGTMFHEVTHQLLGESAKSITDVGQHANFWIIEGIACYMESFRRDEGRFSVGDPLHSRIHWARVRLLDENFYVPMAKLTSLGQREFQRGFDESTLKQVYSQISGIVHFFLHAQHGEYREAFIAHLAQVYSPVARVREHVTPLDTLTGVSFDELDRQYAEYIKNLPSALDNGSTAASK